MIRRADAIRYDRRAENGRTQPLRVTVETADAVEHEVFLKVSAAPQLDTTGLCMEALAACVAGHLSLPVCEPLLVEMSPEWIASIQDPALRGILERSEPIAFGSVAAGEGWRPWLTSDAITLDRRDVARAVLAFDAFTENPDRRPGNPNLLVKRNEFRVIDHELALRVQGLFPPAHPWRVGGLAWLSEPDRHVLAAGLKGTTALDLAPVKTAWSGLTDAVLADCEATVPIQWAAGAGAVTAALAHLKAVRDSIDDCLQELERTLG